MANKIHKIYANFNNNFQTIYLLQGHYIVPTQPAAALSFLCILLDVLRSLFDAEAAHQSHCISPRYFFDGTLKYAHMDRLGGNLSYLRNLYRNELIEALGANHCTFTEDVQDRENRSDMSLCKWKTTAAVERGSPCLKDIDFKSLNLTFIYAFLDSAMFLITGSESNSNEFVIVDQSNR